MENRKSEEPKKSFRHHDQKKHNGKYKLKGSISWRKWRSTIDISLCSTTSLNFDLNFSSACTWPIFLLLILAMWSAPSKSSKVKCLKLIFFVLKKEETLLKTKWLILWHERWAIACYVEKKGMDVHGPSNCAKNSTSWCDPFWVEGLCEAKI